MALKWTGNNSDSGILRKSEFKEKKEELFVFGYSCKLFRDDEKALHIDQGKHLIPWMGDDTLKIDRYDARGALHDVSRLEAPPGGFDWRVELTRQELDVELLCDEERYRALHTDEDEEEMYKEEELKRLHAAGYGQVGFNYDAPEPPEPAPPPAEVDEPFLADPHYKALFSTEIVFPETEKQNAIIEKTAKFIASQGAQMEILIKAKQGDNPQFQFLNRESELHPYYMALIGLVKAGKWPKKISEAVVEERPHEHEDYLHPSLASTVIESAPSIPSIHYRPSADCDYTMLISKMRDEAPPEEPYSQQLAPGEVAPPGTEPLPPRVHADISRAPVMYHQGVVQPATPPPPMEPAAPSPPQPRYAAYYHQYLAQVAAQAQAQAVPAPPAPAPASAPRSTGLSLMKNYNTDSGSDVSDCDDSSSTEDKEKDSKCDKEKRSPNIPTPPEDIQLVIDKMAAYVARNGAEFADIVRAKGDPRFTFLDPSNEYYAYYRELLREKRGEGRTGKTKAPVSFSIKKQKEPETVLPKPALPYESSSEDDEKNKQAEKTDENTDPPKTVPGIPGQITSMPVLYKIDGIGPQVNAPVVKPVESPKVIPKPLPNSLVAEVKTLKKDNTSVQVPPTKYQATPKVDAKKSPENKVDRHKETERESSKKDKKYKEKKEYKVKKVSLTRDRREEKEKRREREKDKERKKVKKKKPIKDDLEDEIISLEDNSDVLIDLTGDISDSKDGEVELDRAKQQERRRRAAAFLKNVGVDPAAAALPASSLASAMVDTLESIRKKKAEEEEKRLKREKRRNRSKHGHDEATDRSHRKSKRRKYKSSDDNDESDNDHDSSKKKKRKKEKKSKSKRKRRKEPEPEHEKEIDDSSLNIDLTTTLKGLRTSSPTKELVLQDFGSMQQSGRRDSPSLSEDEEPVIKRSKRMKENREYSDGEWSSDFDIDSGSLPSKNGDYD